MSCRNSAVPFDVFEYFSYLLEGIFWTTGKSCSGSNRSHNLPRTPDLQLCRLYWHYKTVNNVSCVLQTLIHMEPPEESRVHLLQSLIPIAHRISHKTHVLSSFKCSHLAGLPLFIQKHSNFFKMVIQGSRVHFAASVLCVRGVTPRHDKHKVTNAVLVDRSRSWSCRANNKLFSFGLLWSGVL